LDGILCLYAERRLKTLRRRAADQTIVVELDEAEWEAVAEREHRLVALENALASVSGADLGPSLVRVAKALPLAASVETVGIRLLARDTSRLHLVAHEGLPARSVRDLALDPIPVATQRSIFSLGGYHSLARSLGLRYLGGEWLQTDASLIGSLTVGSGTDRRPSPPERELIRETAASLAESLEDVDRDEERLRTVSLAMARAAILEPPDLPEARLAALRPREATVLELYADGRSVDEIASLLVISPHTVRTHIKLAFRRLGIHSREEAADLVYADELTALF
jgi:DNA-binding CsgD family transcriptional regulator